MNQDRPIWQKSRVELFRDLDCSDEGLSSQEAAARLEKNGPNELQGGKRKSVLRIFLEQFADFLVIILILAAIVSAVLGDVESTVVILAVITMNAILGTVQTVKAAASLDSLKQMSAPTAKVVRDGRVIQIPGREVTVGDVVVLEAGDSVCADGRLLECASLKCAESALTGESLPVEKDVEVIAGDVPLGDRKNMVFSGSFVTYGRAKFLVTDIGMGTEMGKIATLLKSTEEKKTPLQVSLDQFGKKLSIGILVICALLFAVSVLWRGENVMNAFLFAVALAVAAIPEALSSIVTIVLSFGTQKMAREHAIIRKLQAVEGLGSVSVICSDKTGTLTQNKMTVKKLYVAGRVIPVAEADFNDPIQEPLLRTALLCSDATVNEDGEVGDPTETALVHLGEDHGFDEEVTRNKYPRLTEIPFDSDRKLMSTVHRLSGGLVMVTKGAVDVMLDRCVISPQERAEVERVNEEFSSQGLRVLAFACRTVESTAVSLEDENGLDFLGLIAMMDPPREESKAAVAECIAAGIRPIMITGDHKVTASAIAKEIGIMTEGTEAVEGAVIESMSDQELQDFVPRVSVYARVSPEHKIRIVRAWQERGCLVAMTGDGVNDAPALKVADIGCAMGVTGTDVAKGAADMILTDDNFATIVSAVEQGRGIYANIKKAIHYLLSCNIGEILTIFCATVFHFHQMPLVPVQLLWLNLVTDSLPALALGVEPVEEGVMSQPPRDAHASLFAHGFAFRLAWQGVMVGLLTLAAYFLGEYVLSDPGEAHAAANTMAFATLTLCQLFHAFDVRSERSSLFHIGVFSNPAMNKAFLIGLTMQLAVLCVPPLQVVFSTVPMSPLEWAVVLALAITPVVVCELAKAVSRGRTRRPARAEKVEPACARR